MLFDLIDMLEGKKVLIIIKFITLRARLVHCNRSYNVIVIPKK